MEYDLLCFIGRCQPFHKGHQRVIDLALQRSKKVLILLGSAGKARTIRNPFTFEERAELITKHYGIRSQDIIIQPLYDKMYNDAAWIKQVQGVVTETALEIVNNGGFRLHGTRDMKIGLIGASKDKSSYYLKLFPQWESVDVKIKTVVDATYIRDNYFAGTYDPWLWRFDILPESSINFLKQFAETEDYAQLTRELQHVTDYKKAWEQAPYPVKHVTVDAVVEQSGHVLLVKRRSEPGKGLWALAGGHLNVDETLIDGAIRELQEETKIKVPEPVLRGSIVNQRTFDNPYRSTLGRVITHAVHIKLRDEVTLPKVKGSDDAVSAKWIPINELREDMLFDDHFFIIQSFLGV